MSHKNHTVSALYARLKDGITSEQLDIPRELIARLRERLGARGDEIKWVGAGCYGSFAFNHLRLLGASNVGYLILGGEADVKAAFATFWEEKGGAGKFGLVLAASAELKAQAQAFAVPERCVVLDDAEGRILLEETHHPLDYFKERIRAQIPVRRLIPYDITRPAAPNMFFGRRDLLKRILYEDTTSFAIAGPGRIGKSSLVQQVYRAGLAEGRRDRACLIDCFPYGQLAPDELALRLALDISATSDANRVTASTLLRFLRRHSADGDRPLELLLDEVDGVCHSAAFEAIGDAVKHGYCRVILCGKGGLLRMMTHGTASLGSRLTLIQPEPLDTDSAQRLLLEPLLDLGFKIPDPTDLCDLVFELTQRRPHLIQACAKQMIGLALADDLRAIGRPQFEAVLNNFGALAMTLLPLDAMSDDEVRLAALLLLESGLGDVNIGRLQEMFETAGMELSAAKAFDICQDLWICNVLTWEKDTFALTNRHLVDYAQHMNLHREINRLRQALGCVAADSKL